MKGNFGSLIIYIIYTLKHHVKYINLPLSIILSFYDVLIINYWHTIYILRHLDL